MHIKKVGVHIGLQTPVFFRHILAKRPDDDCCIHLIGFHAEPSRVEWQVRLGNGTLVQGLAGINQKVPLPLWPDFKEAYIAMKMPVTLNLYRGSFSADFILGMPNTFVPEFNYLAGRS